ncbi:DUF3999 domain-containing protein [Candidatus Electronema sp. TJ]|uniref:DUF3999 domain-containing protein n=1 Tax=Candidatus Electronema sp. TJ TaxID=3401573 RepID=UPI003AA86194
MNRLLILLLMLAAAPCLAKDDPQPLRLEDFAYGMELKVKGNSPVASLSLPAEVYQGCVRPDLGDLRVFNSNGPVPHLLRPPQPEQAAHPAQSLPFFPLSTPSGQGRAADIGIAIGNNGALIAFSTGGAEKAEQAIAAYILDSSALKQRPDWLEFAWQGQGRQFSVSVQLDSSDDLNSWQPLASAALAELSFGGHKLLRNRIELDGKAEGKYLRLTWPQGKEGISLSAAQAGYESETRAQARSLLPLNGTPDPAAAPGRAAWLYSTGGFFPADQLNIRLPEQNALAEFAIFSRPDEQAAWQRRASLLAWRLTVDGVKLENGLLHLAPVTDRYWRLETEAGSSAAPVLELGWLPGQLVFMAQGGPPYTLAYGRAGLEPVRSQVGQLLKAAEPVSGSKLIEAAQAEPQRVLAGQAALEIKKEFPWRVWLLWAGLIAGVLVVGAMALKLFREMNGRSKETA